MLSANKANESAWNQQIVLAEYSRLVVLFLVLGQYLTQLWQVKGHIFGNSMIFQLYESISLTQVKGHIFVNYMIIQLYESISAKISILAA